MKIMCTVKLFHSEKTVSIDRTDSLGLWRYGKEFCEAADIINKQSQTTGATSVIAYYLICHSLELTMKAYLRGKGYSIHELMKLRHDLKKILKKTERENIGNLMHIPNAYRVAISIVNPYYKGKEFEYIKAGSKTFPDIDILLKFASELTSKTKIYCESNQKLHYGKKTANS